MAPEANEPCADRHRQLAVTGPRHAGLVAVCAVAMVVAGCARGRAPEDVALEYGRAIYAYDAAKIHGLVSIEDQQAKDEETVRAQLDAPRGFALELMRQLAPLVTAVPVETHITDHRASVKLRFTLPDANAAALRTLARDWDERRLDALAQPERARIRRDLDELNQRRALPVLQGEETFELVKEGGVWRLALGWAGGIPIRFGASVAESLSLEVTVSPPQIRVKPGESFRVTVRARNVSGHDVTSRVGHRIAPPPDANFLALLQCHLFLPATFNPGETKEFVSEYLLLKDVPERVKTLEVTYGFGAATRDSE